MKILVPVDGSECSNAALDFLSSRKTLLDGGAKIHLVNVQHALSPRVVRAVGRDEANRYLHDQADAALRPASRRLQAAGIQPSTSQVLGNRPDAIGMLAVRQRFDLIVMGSRGHSPMKGLLFGSMTNAVLATCTKPLLIVRSAKIPRRDALKVGIALDGSAHAKAAVQWTLRHLELFGTEPDLHLIHVLESEPATAATGRGRTGPGKASASSASADPALRRMIDPVQRRLDKQGIAATVAPLAGRNPGDAISAYATKAKLDILVMGSHGRGAMQSMLLGSVAMRVAARCALPLLLVREP